MSPWFSRRFVALSIATLVSPLLACSSSGEDCQFCSGGTVASVTMTGPMTDTDPTSGTDTDPSMPTSGSASTTNDVDPTTVDTDPPTTLSGTDTDIGTDTGTDTIAGTTEAEPIIPCTGIDFLFVIDNSVGMAEEQARIQATAFAFVSMVTQQAPTAMGNVSVAVIGTDEPEFVVPSGEGSVPYSSGLNYMRWDPMSADANATLQAELTGALAVGEGGDPNERPMDMLLEALTGDTADEFNIEFLQEDSLLVVVLVSDEEDDIEEPTLWGSEGDPPDWIDQLATVKDGILKDIVVLSIVPQMSACGDDTNASRLIEFTEAFPVHGVQDVCSPDYSAFLLGETAAVVSACNNFSPP